MSRRKQSHPRAWKETFENKQSNKSNADTRPESPSDQQDSSSDPEELPLDPHSLGFLHTLEEASIGETFGPVAATIWEDSRILVSSGKLLSDSKVTRSLRMVLTTADGSEESFTFLPVFRKEDAHLIVQRNYDGVYVKVAKKFDSATELRGFCVSMERYEGDFDGVQVKQESSSEPAECHSHSRTCHQKEEESPFISKKCPNCSVCFRNVKNLEAHQKYYCTGLAHNSQATPQHDQGTCKRFDASKSSSPSLPARSSSRTSTDNLDAPFVHVCQLCQSSFTSKQNCESHMLILHCSEHVAMCKFCNFVAQSWDILREHVFSHVKRERRSDKEHVDNNQQVSCQDCEVHVRHSEEDNSSEEEAISTTTQHRISVNGVQREFIHSPSGQKVPTGMSSRLHHDPREMSQDACHVKRTSDGDQPGAKRAKEECSSPSPHQKVDESNLGEQSVGGIHPIELSHHSGGRNMYPEQLVPMPTLRTTVCTACNICFRSKANFMAHKKYYCKERHAENKDTASVSNNRRDMPRYQSPRQSEPPPLHHGENEQNSKEGTKPRESPPGTEGSRVMKPPSLMYMSPMVPSAMLVGGTQLISPSGAHVISPIFLLAPPVAIPVTGVETSFTSPSSESRMKRIGKDDSPLGLSVRPSVLSPEENRTSPTMNHNTDLDNDEEEDPSTSKKSFSCSHCGVTFWKAKTLVAHKQFYCSKISKSVSPTSPSRSPHHTGSTLLHYTKTSPRTEESGESETPIRETSAINSPSSNSKGLEFRNHSHIPGAKKSLRNIPNQRSPQDYHLQERHGKPMYIPDALIHHPHGLHHCLGCGVAFRKMESLEIHQKFYCQKSKPGACSTASSHPGVTPKKVNGHWEDPLQQSHSLGIGRSQPSNVEPCQMQDSVPKTSSYSFSKIEKDIRYTDSLTTSEPGEPSKKDSMVGCKDRRGSSSPVLEGGYSYFSSSLSRGHERLRSRSWPSSVGKGCLPKCTRTFSMESSLTMSHGHIPKLLSVKSEPSDLPDHPQGSKEVVSTHENVSIKVEVESPPGCEPADIPSKSKPEKIQSPIDRKSWGIAHFSQTIHHTDSSFPPGSKACRSCNISFRSLSTFIAHKKYYCSAATSQKSKITT